MVIKFKTKWISKAVNTYLTLPIAIDCFSEKESFAILSFDLRV